MPESGNEADALSDRRPISRHYLKRRCDFSFVTFGRISDLLFLGSNRVRGSRESQVTIISLHCDIFLRMDGCNAGFQK